MDLLEIAKNNSKKNAPFYYKFLSMLSVVRGFNIAVIVLAQYLAAIFIFSPQKSLRFVLTDIHLYFIVLATACTIAAGYIINNFYDKEKDKINKPQKFELDNFVSQKTKLQVYFLLNLLGFAFGFLVSWRAALFFAVYIFLIWFYSHKLKKEPLTGLFSAAILALLPFFAVFVYYKNFSEVIFVHATFLFFILLIRELVKDLENIKGDIAQNYMTIPIKYDDQFTKILISFFIIFTISPIYFILRYDEIGNMKYYFYFAGIVLLIFSVLLWMAKTKNNYIVLHNIIKLLIVIGVLSLMFIDTSVIIDRLV
ncbi:MAG: geranylgeranylglycerol-phosphate geranylgeranyltransferase [Flavobacteriaceae bacterium]